MKNCRIFGGTSERRPSLDFGRSGLSLLLHAHENSAQIPALKESFINIPCAKNKIFTISTENSPYLPAGGLLKNPSFENSFKNLEESIQKPSHQYTCMKENVDENIKLRQNPSTLSSLVSGINFNSILGKRKNIHYQENRDHKSKTEGIEKKF
jgi:hypothetical protein